jgi:transcription initiation factor TFIIH subunit 2
MATNGRRQMVEDDEDIIDVDDSSLMNNQANYAWEEEYKRSWDVLQEDEHGSLAGVVNSLQQAAKRKRYVVFMFLYSAKASVKVQLVLTLHGGA